jgi:hypothetical protein
LSRRVLNQKFELHIEEHALWLKTWKAAGGGAKGPIKILPIAFLRLPAVTDISPTPIVIVNVLIQVVNSIRLNQATRNDFSTVNILEAVLDVITLRLINIVNGNFLSNTDDLLKAVNNLDNILRLEIAKSMQTNPDEIQRAARLILRQPTEINELRKKIKSNKSVELVSRMCKKCMINKVDIECSQLVIECNSPASFTLPCNHEVNWICGTEEDPRENLSNCQSCILIKWESIIKSDITTENNQKLFNQIEKNIDKFLADFANIKNNQIVTLPDDFESHDKCRREIMSRYITNARNRFINISKPNTETLADLGFYELVFFKRHFF